MVDMPVHDVLHEGPRLEEALLKQARLAIDADHADAIVLGCTGMFGTAERLAAALGGQIPVIDPISAAVSEAVRLVRLGLSHSKRTYPSPPL